MTIKTKFLKNDFVTILSGYDLGKYKKARLLTTGKVQTNFILLTTKGKFVFRYYENRSENSVLFESDLIKYLTENNYPCTTQLQNKEGKFVCNYKDKPFIIFKFIEGSHLKHPNENQKNELIKKIAELHKLTRNYKSEYTKFRLNYNIKNCLKLANRETKKLNTKDAKEKLKWFKNEVLKLELPEALPKGICHCDSHFLNVLFKDGKFNALIYFDDANYTFLIYDLAFLINPFIKSFKWNTWKKFEKQEDVFDFKKTRKIVSEYMKYRKLNKTEKENLFDVFKLSIMFDCIWYYERGNAYDFYEKRKIKYLNSLGRKKFYKMVFE